MSDPPKDTPLWRQLELESLFGDLREKFPELSTVGTIKAKAEIEIHGSLAVLEEALQALPFTAVAITHGDVCGLIPAPGGHCPSRAPHHPPTGQASHPSGC